MKRSSNILIKKFIQLYFIYLQHKHQATLLFYRNKLIQGNWTQAKANIQNY